MLFFVTIENTSKIKGVLLDTKIVKKVVISFLPEARDRSTVEGLAL